MDIKKKAGSLKEILSGSTALAAKYKKAIIILIVGVLMIIVGNFIIKSNKKETPNNLDQNTAKPQTKENSKDQIMSPDEYSEFLQKQIEDLLTSIDGVGKVKALVYVDQSCEVVPAYDSDKSESSLEETDSQGGKRNQNESNDKENLADNNGTVVLKVIYPKIQGICISAQGAKSNVTKEKIKNALMALYGIEAHRIEIVSMKNWVWTYIYV